MLNWLKQFNTFCFLDSSQYQGTYDFLVGAGEKTMFQSSETNALEAFQAFTARHRGWLFGHLGYELATVEKISHSAKADQLLFPDIFFFEPRILLVCKGNELTIEAQYPYKVFDAIEQSPFLVADTNKPLPPVQSRMTREAYIATIEQIKKHIQRGDCYEINFCQEFFIDDADVDPFSLFEKLNQKSPNPFSALYRLNDKWLLCASPERFIKKENGRIFSQPIKGTLRRTNSGNDLEKERQLLAESEKDRAENVMIVDLVRNDLSRICKEGSVQVDELFGIYSFPQVHQMISTISGTLSNSVDFKDIINATFPMGSMTGAPKVKVMQLIDHYEKSRRGIFSGALGYIQPGGDFDFNVVIRSIIYNQTTQYLSFQAGGGITIYSDAEKEWEESLLKAKAIKDVLSS
ncbi:aminodeoxychorismate synthase component I [Niabella yanshanensis]|uniref:Aminodeoxychorismate synthase component I n=1 Tax=Niabella yanshanensis TaxID=577386 RepID=A0ABZ0WDJ8_9BACT|nr:aminodeoxychorismate synthase component I [Niabella yanshanensis]WQD40785.1 aminodeoxychorismate synthase component I [Niabella yanshanensis]